MNPMMTLSRPRRATATLIQLACAGALLATAACGSTPPPYSPHPYDFVPGPDDTYMPNEAVTLTREYWVIFQQPDGTHYMFPRPDGEPLLAEACAADDAFGLMLQTAQLCHEAASSADVARVNALTIEEARQISTYLHGRLLFEPGEGDTTPHALISDTIDVCNTQPAVRQGALLAVCDRELGWADGGSRPSIFNPLTEDEASALAASLNQLYEVVVDAQ